MNRFLRLPALALLGLSLATTACKKEEGLQVQPHDQSTQMTIMHDMMKMMDAMKPTGDPDNDYAMMMIMHHQGAINMSQEELKSGADADMKAMAQSIITAQQKEIAQFQAFLTSHPAQAPAVPDFSALQMANMMRMSQANDLRPLTGNPDFDFAQLMVDHHRSAIENSDAVLKYGRQATTKALAQQIIDEQKSEITMLQTWLLNHKPY
ncbi:DUF305 domain-containing protein [Hymenobacter setariae]|jgi:uncharacterized protein (DUF305 family)|uniref:DUF305 domain-containing protein n=1 Tax=Hymenobacter setariae TaxID=2594794 RepID=A0A558BKM5_9BACT|nr:DUF305 domain-containing protein [Hymenobacter setariae]TVT37047.1 DUF305 domain-containing protein [Hymenobacter setariae]